MTYWRLGTLIALALAGVLFAVVASAVTLKEPTTRADGSPLTGLKSCTYTVSAPGQVPGSATITASSPSGGGSHPITATTFEGAVTIKANCIRSAGGVDSAPSADASLSTTFPVAATGAPELLP